MLCPTDQTVLQMTERYGVEIDYCPVCRGVWLDRGELDKILETAARVLTPSAATAYPADYGTPPRGTDDRHRERDEYGDRRHRGDRDDRYRDDRYRDDRFRDSPDRYRGDGYRKKRKESWLEDLFDF